MAISRAQMGSQMKGNRMNCKGTKKMQAGGMMPDAEGNYSAVPQAGKQAMEQAVAQAMAVAKDKAPRKDAAPLMRKVTGMKKMKSGGRVRGDGVCQRGKTKGTMR